MPVKPTQHRLGFAGIVYFGYADDPPAKVHFLRLRGMAVTELRVKDAVVVPAAGRIQGHVAVG